MTHEHMMFLSSSVARLLLAALLGGLIGLDRALHRKTAGIRTTMFICMGAAMFTILSDTIPDPSVADRTRIASNIVQGVGFLGAGAILHGKFGVAGLTTAATIWLVASIGMACGAGHYLLASFATATVLLALNVLGYLETAFGLKLITLNYEVTGAAAPDIIQTVNQVLEDGHHMMQNLQIGRAMELARVAFSVTCTLPEHKRLQSKLRMHQGIEQISTFDPVVEE